MRALFDRLSDSYAKYYSLTDHSAVAEIILLLKVRVIFREFIPKKHKRFGIKLDKLCDSEVCTDNTTVCMQRQETCDSFHYSYTCDCNRTYCKDWECATQVVLYTDSLFSSPSDNLYSKTINCCRTVRPNRKGMLESYGYKINLKRLRWDVTWQL